MFLMLIVTLAVYCSGLHPGVHVPLLGGMQKHLTELPES
jgi:hypothetical protein